MKGKTQRIDIKNRYSIRAKALCIYLSFKIKPTW
jgi:hypothetical protein